MMKRLLPLGGLLLCVSACAESGPVDRGSFFDPGTGDDEMDGGADAGEADPDDTRDGGRPDRDAATPRPDGGSSLPDASTDPLDAAVDPVDAGVADAGGGMDATTPDAGGQDAGGEADAGTADAGTRQDAGTSDDAGQPEPDAGPSCGTEGLVAGNSCAGVVTCQDNNFSGNPVLECVLFADGAPQKHCCTALFASNSCRSGACGSNDDEAACDGPEDCTGSACCFNGGATSCGASCATTDTLCHGDADCPSGTHCEAGNAAGRYSWWGFCAS